MSKRIKKNVTPAQGGGVNVGITCKICGKPIVKSNTYGMYCEDECGKEDDIKAYEKIKNMFGGLLDM